MTDSEKLALIGLMTADFWECMMPEQHEKCAIALVTSISSVVNFKGGDTDV